MKFLSKRSAALVLTSMMLMLTACSSSNTTDAQIAQEGYPVTVENCGTNVTFDSPPERLLLLKSASVPALKSLDVLNRVVARGGAFPNEYYDSQTQEQLDKIPELSDELDASGHLQISKEVVLSQQPDLVLGEVDNLDRATLSDAGISLIEENTLCKTGAPEHPSFDDVYSQLSLYGTIFQKEDKAKEEIDKLKKRVNDAENKVKNKKTRTAAVLYPTVGGGTTYAYGTKSMAEPQLEAAGFKNVFDDVDQRVFEITPEELVKRNPDVLIMLHSEGDPQKVKEAVTSLPGADSLTALKNGDTMVQLMNFTEPATPLTVDGLENIIDRFYK